MGFGNFSMIPAAHFKPSNPNLLLLQLPKKVSLRLLADWPKELDSQNIERLLFADRESPGGFSARLASTSSNRAAHIKDKRQVGIAIPHINVL